MGTVAAVVAARAEKDVANSLNIAFKEIITYLDSFFFELETILIKNCTTLNRIIYYRGRRHPRLFALNPFILWCVRCDNLPRRVRERDSRAGFFCRCGTVNFTRV